MRGCNRGDDSYDKVQLEDGIGGWGWLGVFVGVVVVVGEEGWGSYGGWRLGGNRGWRCRGEITRFLYEGGWCCSLGERVVG